MIRTELDMYFDYKDDPEFSSDTLKSFLYAVLTGPLLIVILLSVICNFKEIVTFILKLFL